MASQKTTALLETCSTCGCSCLFGCGCRHQECEHCRCDRRRYQKGGILNLFKKKMIK